MGGRSSQGTTSRKSLTISELLQLSSTKQNMLAAFGDQAEVDNWIQQFHAKESNYTTNTYWRIEGKDQVGQAGVGKGLYIGKDRQALENFYNIEGDGKLAKYRGEPVWLDLAAPARYAKFESEMKKKGIEIAESDKIGAIVKAMGYDGIRYYDPQATGEEFVLFNTKVLKKIKRF